MASALSGSLVALAASPREASAPADWAAELVDRTLREILGGPKLVPWLGSRAAEVAGVGPNMWTKTRLDARRAGLRL